MNQGDGNVMMFANGSDDTLIFKFELGFRRDPDGAIGNDLIVR